MYRLKKEFRQLILNDEELLGKIRDSITNSKGERKSLLTVIDWFRLDRPQSRTKEVIEILAGHFNVDEKDMFTKTTHSRISE